MKNLFINFGFKEKYNGFLISLDYQTNFRACVLIGIYKRFYLQFNRNGLNLGFIYIGYKNIFSLLKPCFFKSL